MFVFCTLGYAVATSIGDEETLRLMLDLPNPLDYRTSPPESGQNRDRQLMSKLSIVCRRPINSIRWAIEIIHEAVEGDGKSSVAQIKSALSKKGQNEADINVTFSRLKDSLADRASLVSRALFDCDVNELGNYYTHWAQESALMPDSKGLINRQFPLIVEKDMIRIRPTVAGETNGGFLGCLAEFDYYAQQFAVRKMWRR